jgi:hypothetical protein
MPTAGTVLLQGQIGGAGWNDSVCTMSLTSGTYSCTEFYPSGTDLLVITQFPKAGINPQNICYSGDTCNDPCGSGTPGSGNGKGTFTITVNSIPLAFAPVPNGPSSCYMNFHAVVP